MTSQKFLTGILLGIGIGVLLAPNKGSETRKKVSKKIKDASDCVQDTLKDIKEQITHVANKSVDALENINDIVHEAAMND